MPQILTNIRTDTFPSILRINTSMECITMNQWQLPAYFPMAVKKNVFESVVCSNESVEVRRGRGRQVHDEVGESRWKTDLHRARINLFLGFTGSAETSLHARSKAVDMTGDGVVHRFRGSRQSVQVSYRCGDEVTRISIEGAENSLHLVAPCAFLEGGVCVGVDIICPGNNLIFRGWHREWAGAGHDISNCFTWLEEGDDALMLIFESGIPIHLREVKSEFAVGLGRDDFGVRGACKELHRESTVGGPGADILDLINHGGDDGVFVEDEVGEKVLVREVWVAEVKMSNVANLEEDGRTGDVLGKD